METSILLEKVFNSFFNVIKGIDFSSNQTTRVVKSINTASAAKSINLTGEHYIASELAQKFSSVSTREINKMLVSNGYLQKLSEGYRVLDKAKPYTQVDFRVNRYGHGFDQRLFDLSIMRQVAQDELAKPESTRIINETQLNNLIKDCDKYGI